MQATGLGKAIRECSHRSKQRRAGAAFILLGACLLLNRGTTFGAGDIFGYFWPSFFVIR